MRLHMYRTLYMRFKKETNHVKSNLIINLFTSLILAIFLCFVKVHLALEGFTLVFALLHLLGSLINNDQEIGGFHRLVAFLRHTPFHSTRVVGYNYLLRAFHLDQLILYAMLLCTVLLFHVPAVEQLLFFARLLMIHVIAQFLESLIFLISSHFVVRTLTQAAIFLSCLLVMQEHLWQNAQAIYFRFANTFALDEVMFVVTVLAILLIVPLTERILFRKRTSMPRLLEPLSRFLSLGAQLVFWDRKLKAIVRVLMIRFFRDGDVLATVTKITLMGFVYVLFSSSLTQQGNFVLNFSWMLGLLFFSEFDVGQKLQAKAKFDFFPITDEQKKVAVDLVGFFLYVIYCLILTALVVIAVPKTWPMLDALPLPVLIFGMIRYLIRIPLHPSKRQTLIVNFKYSITCLCLIVLFQLAPYIVLQLICLLVVSSLYYVKLKRKGVILHD